MSDRLGASPGLLSLLPARPGQRRLALGVACLLLAVFLATLPFARIGWFHLPAFVLTQKTLMLVSDLITSALLFGQYSIGRLHAFNILAGGYLFTALIAVPHTLTFPEVLSQTGLLGAGPQTAAYLYMAAHAALPLTIIAAALQRKHADTAGDPTDGVIGSIAGMVLAIIVAVAATTLLVTRGHQWLPPLIDNGYFTSEARIAVGALLALPLAALQFLAASNTVRLKGVLQQSAEQAARAAEIIRHLRDFIAGHDSEKRADDIPEMLRNAVNLALLGIDPPIPAIEMRLSSVAPSAFFDRVQIEQVVFNLVRNAIEAMGDSERRVLTITTRLAADNMVE